MRRLWERFGRRLSGGVVLLAMEVGSLGFSPTFCRSLEGPGSTLEKLLWVPRIPCVTGVFRPFLSQVAVIMGIMTTSDRQRRKQLENRLLGEFPSVDAMERELVRLEGLISKVRARQIEILTLVDQLEVPRWDGARSLKEWIAGRLDLQPRNAGDLAVLAKAEAGPISSSMKAGVTSVDRAAATTRLASTGADKITLDRADGIAVGQIGQLAARNRRMTPMDEAAAFRARRLWFQPNLGNTFGVGSFAMTGADMDAVIDAIDKRADEIVNPDDPNRPALEQRRADALVSLALDAEHPCERDGQRDGGTGRVAPRRLKAQIFVNAAESAESRGETGALSRSGIKVGPNTLEEIFCIGETQTTAITTEGLVAIPTDGDRLPNRIREFVFFRDGGCTADGCTSRYRLEPHHVQPRRHEGDHEPDNLTLLCWFHHHVVVHQEGITIDPVSPPKRRRFLAPGVTRAPPPG